MTPTENQKSTERWVFVFLLIVTAFMTLKYFPGLEHTDAYAGNTFSAIYPDAFPNDPFIDPDRPFWKRVFQLSLIYLPAHLMGEIWLDDRFVAVVYFGLVFATLVAVDKMVQLLGIRGLMPRALIQLLFMRDHQYLTLTATFANQPDINHAAYVIPATAWLLYSTFARKSIWIILLFSFLVAASSLKMAPYVIGGCLIITAMNGDRRDRLIVLGLFAAATVIFFYVLFGKFYLVTEDRLYLWNYLLNSIEKWDSNPWHPFDSTNVLARNIVFLVIAVSAWLVPYQTDPVMKDMKLIVFMGLCLYAFASLYYTFAPDVLKYPHFMSFSMVRNLRWPQTLAYLILFAAAFRWLEMNLSGRNLVGASLLLGALFVTGPSNHELWMALTAVCCVASAAMVIVLDRRETRVISVTALWRDTRNAYLFLFTTFALTIVIAFGSTIQKRIPDWIWMSQHGIYGGSEMAKWNNLIGFVRDDLPKDTMLLPLEYQIIGGEEVIRARRHIGSRTGRAISVMRENSSMFDIPGLKFELEHQANMARFEAALYKKEWDRAKTYYDLITPQPTHLILPAKHVDDDFKIVFNVVELTTIDDFTILAVRN